MSFNKLAVGIVSGTAGVATGIFLERKGLVKVPDFITRKYAAYKVKKDLKEAGENLAKTAQAAAEATMKAAVKPQTPPPPPVDTPAPPVV